MPIEQYTYWSITINNPDENDRLIIRNPNEKYIRSMVWTPERGEEGTRHIQGWVRFQRNQALSFVKKLYPRAHCKPCVKDEYNENVHQYAQKDDETTEGPHHIILNDPLPANDTLLYKVLERAAIELFNADEELARIYNKNGQDVVFHNKFTLHALETKSIEREMVMERAGLEKIFCSPAYEKMKQTFFRQILYRILKAQQDASTENTHDEGRESVSEGKRDSEDYEESCSETDGGSTEGSGDQTDEEDD